MDATDKIVIEGNKCSEVLDVSIIVPVHNCAETLERCVDSIASSKGGVKEIILIHNGSKDNSLAVCKELSLKYSNVIYYDLDIANVCDARNLGIEKSTGGFFAFVDGDDTINDEMYYRLISDAAQNNSDISFCRYAVLGERDTTYRADVQLEYMIEHKRYDYMIYPTIGLGSSVCRAIYKRSVIGDVRFDNRIYFIEDRTYLIEAMSKAHKMTAIDYYGYNYYEPLDFVKKYYKKGCGASILHVVEKIKTLIGEQNPEIVDYIKFDGYYILCSVILYQPQYDRESANELNTAAFKVLNTAQSYKEFVKYQSKTTKVKAFFCRHKMVKVLYMLLKLKAKLSKGK